MKDEQLKNVYCPSCKHFVGREDIQLGQVQFRCKYCKTWVVVVGRNHSRGIIGGEIDIKANKYLNKTR